MAFKLGFPTTKRRASCFKVCKNTVMCELRFRMQRLYCTQVGQGGPGQGAVAGQECAQAWAQAHSPTADPAGQQVSAEAAEGEGRGRAAAATAAAAGRQRRGGRSGPNVASQRSCAADDIQRQPPQMSVLKATRQMIADWFSECISLRLTVWATQPSYIGLAACRARHCYQHTLRAEADLLKSARTAAYSAPALFVAASSRDVGSWYRCHCNSPCCW